MSTSKENTRIIIDAITEDALIYLDISEPDDFGGNALHKRCLERIGNEFGAQDECKAALDKISQIEKAIQSNAPAPCHESNWPARPLTIAMAFFEAAMGDIDTETRKALFSVMRHIADLMESQSSTESCHT